MNTKDVIKTFHAQNFITFLAAKQVGKECAILLWRASKESDTPIIAKNLIVEAGERKGDFEKNLKIAFPNSPNLWPAVMETVNNEQDFYLTQLGAKINA